jgi:type I restriction enzyme M protein
MNLAVNGLRGEIQSANSYYEDPYESYHKFDYVMANPPFNVDDVNLIGLNHRNDLMNMAYRKKKQEYRQEKR